MHSTNRFSRQQRITNSLLLNASFIDNLGLMHGKMGIAIYFFQLARETENKIYEDYAEELIDEIYDEISIHTPYDFENGLAGIGWGIEFLAQNGFISANTDEVLESIDNNLEQVIQNIQEIGLLSGLLGLGAYYLKRIQNPTSTIQKITLKTNKQILQKVIDKIKSRLDSGEITKIINNDETFVLISYYPTLLLFWGEIYHLKEYKCIAESVMQQLIGKLFEKENIPQLQSKRLLLAMAIVKILKIEGIGYTKNVLEGLIDTLLTEVSRERISTELTSNSYFLGNGITGIVWIYNEMFVLTNDSKYQRESAYWSSKIFEANEMESLFAGFNIPFNQEKNAFGILEGIAGISMFGLKKIFETTNV